MRNLTAGQRNQLFHEVKSVESIKDIKWNTMALHDNLPEKDFERRTPLFLRIIILRYIYFWYILCCEYKKYDFIITRYSPFDPLVVLSFFFKNKRITYHHSIEKEELALIKNGISIKLAILMERMCSIYSANNVRAILGVTNEIGNYHAKLAKQNVKYCVYPNGINSDFIQIADDNRKDKQVNIVFLCGKFSVWQGLDILLDNIAAEGLICEHEVNIYLIGYLTTEQKKQAASIRDQKIHIHIKETLKKNEYDAILSIDDVGIDSLGLERKKLSEASTLKSKELLAMGLPVFSMHTDVSLKNNFQYYYKADKFSINTLCDYAIQCKKSTRDQIRHISLQYIEKSKNMVALHKFLENLSETI